MGVVGVDVALGQLAGHRGRAVFLHRARSHAADGRGVIGAVDGDGDGTLGAVGGDDLEGLDQLLAHAQGLDLGIGVVKLVFPVAVGVDRELAVIALEVGLGLERGFAGILVGDVELAVGRIDLVFGDRTGVVARLARGDDGGVVGAGNGDGDDLGGGAAMAVVDGHGDGVGDLLTFLQGLDLRLSLSSL